MMSRCRLVPEDIQKWHTTESEGWFGLGPADQKVKLEELARYLYTLISIFEKDEIVKATEPYHLLVRLFSDQCDYEKEPDTNSYSDTNTRITVKKRTEGITLQSPYDPDASYGHKGAGYSLHVAETCNNPDKPGIITDYEVHGAGRSDIGKALPAVDRLSDAGIKPETLFAVSCKLIACNIRRWAKAHLAFFRGLFQWFMYATETLLRIVQAIEPQNHFSCAWTFRRL
jgi:hypothetical protein